VYPRRASSESKVDLPPPEQPEIITNMSLALVGLMVRLPLLSSKKCDVDVLI